MARFVSRIPAWIAGLGLAVLMAGPLPASTHDRDPVFFFVSDELVLNEETIDELCMAEGESGAWILALELKPTGQKLMREFTAAHVGGWLLLVAGGDVVVRARIRESISGATRILLLSMNTKEELSELLRTSFGFSDPPMCVEEEVPFQ